MITAAFSKKQLPIAMNEEEQDTKSFGNIGTYDRSGIFKMQTSNTTIIIKGENPFKL